MAKKTKTTAAAAASAKELRAAALDVCHLIDSFASREPTIGERQDLHRLRNRLMRALGLDG